MKPVSAAALSLSIGTIYQIASEIDNPGTNLPIRVSSCVSACEDRLW